MEVYFFDFQNITSICPDSYYNIFSRNFVRIKIMAIRTQEAPIDITSLKEAQALDKPRTLLALGLDESETESLQYLNELGYIIENGRKQKNIYDQILAQIPNVLIIDVDALHNEAIELTRQLKENPLTYTMPIIIVLGSHDLMMEIAVLEAGAEDYVVKPFSPNVLAARIHTSMRRNIRLQVSNPLTGLRRQGTYRAHVAFLGERRLSTAAREPLAGHILVVADEVSGLTVVRVHV